MIRITPSLYLREDCIREEFIRCGGPGGQKINKVATGVQLRFNLADCEEIPPRARSRLRKKAGKKVAQSGILIIEATSHRSQKENRREARRRLAGLIRDSLKEPRKRKKTSAPKQVKEYRLRQKHKVGEKKNSRKKVGPEDWG